MTSCIACPTVWSITGGEITGNIAYDGDQDGAIRIVAIGTSFSDNNVIPISYKVVEINAPGSFIFDDLGEGIYIIGAFMDVNGNKLPYYNEPLGVYHFPVFLQEGKNMNNINFSIYDFPRGTATIKGNINYSGSAGHIAYIFAVSMSFTPITAISVDLDQANTFSLEGLSAGKYLVFAYLDLDNNIIPGQNEPIGIIKQIINIEKGSLNIVDDIELLDRNEYFGAIEGQISYAGEKKGQPIVLCGGFSNTPLSLVKTNTSDNTFKIDNLDQGDYRIFSFLDVNENSMFNLNEPFSESYLNVVSVENGDNVKNIDIELLDSGQGQITGKTTYTGDKTGIVTSIALGLSPTPIAISISNGPAAFNFEKLASGIYAVGSFMDCNGDFMPVPSEPLGLYTDDIIVLDKNSVITDIDVQLEDTPTGSISGNIEIPGGSPVGTIYLACFGYSRTPIRFLRMSSAGKYIFETLAKGKYIISVFHDVNENGMFDLDEPYAYTPFLLDLGLDSSLTDIDLILTSNPRMLTSVESKEKSYSIEQFLLSNNYPNPFNPSTTIEYNVPQKSFVTIKVLNLLGEEVSTLINEEKVAGDYKIEWNGKDEKGREVPTGIYIYWMKAGDFSQIKKMTFIQ